MVGPRIGWGLDVAPSGALRAVVRTTDSGRLWRSVTPPGTSGAPLTSLTAEGPSDAALVVDRPRHGGAVVWRTGDGGRTWSHGRAVKALFGGEVQFLDRSHGWLTLGGGVAAGSSGLRLLTTNDGGRTWHPTMTSSPIPGEATPGALPFACLKSSIRFVNSLRGFAGGTCAGGRPFFYGSTDGGRTWRREKLAGMPANCQCTVQTPVFFSAEGGVLTAGVPVQPQRVYLTADAGRTWHALAVTAAESGAVSFVDGSHGWVVTAQRTISRTTDAGAHWRSFHTLFTQARIQFVTARDGFAFEDWPHAARIWSTSDAGATWHDVIARHA